MAFVIAAGVALKPLDGSVAVKRPAPVDTTPKGGGLKAEAEEGREKLWKEGRSLWGEGQGNHPAARVRNGGH